MREVIQGPEPVDRLTRLCAAMTAALEAHPEYREGDKAIVMLDDDEWGGIELHGYDDGAEALATLLMHVQAVMKANGKDMDLMFLGQDGVDRI